MKALQRLKAADFAALIAWYSKNQRDFPWRRDPNPYWVWLAEIMSQQTQMATLVPYFHRFIEKFPTVQRLAKADEQDVLAAWAGLGYYSRARNVHRAAQKIVEELGGAFPRTLEGWLELPGVGPYTAAAVVSQAFGVAAPVWDGNVLRVCARLEARPSGPDAAAQAYGSAFRDELQAALRERMQGLNPSAFNQAFMELGATVCTPRQPSCGRCPLQSVCKAHALDRVEDFPPPKPRKATAELRARVQVSLRPHPKRGGYEAYLQKRAAHQWFAGLWDFPSELGGAARPLEELGAMAKSAATIGQVRHQITHHKIFLIGVVEFVRKASQKQEAGWFHLDDLTTENPPVALSTTAKKMIKLLLRDQLALF